jgi:uncharacterized membrane protein YfcA
MALVAAAFFTSALTATFGLGGGLALLALMSAALPAAAVIPIHGVAQLGSNASRLYLQRKHAAWPVVFWFSAGAVLGALLGGRLAVETPPWLLRAGIAAFILMTVWGPRPKEFSPGVKSFFLTGAASSFLTMFFGATAPFTAAILSTTKLGRLAIVATQAACMVVQHGLKIVVFGIFGFAYGEWAWFILAIVLAGFAGSVAGTQTLRVLSEARFSQGFKFILTAIAIYLFVAAAADFRTD